VIIKTQIDDFGKPISTIFPVDLINLDYCEGLDYRGFSKLSTIEALIIRQKEALLANPLSVSFPYFLVLLTHNIPSHEGDPEAKKKYLKFLTRDIGIFETALREQAQTSLNWYLSEECPPAYQHKCFVMGKLFDFAQSNGFKAMPKRITQYLGDKNALMLHYQFQIIPINLHSPVPVYNKMNVIDILNYPVQDEQGNNIVSDQPFIHL